MQHGAQHAAQHRTEPHRTASHRTAQHRTRTAPHSTPQQRIAPHGTAPLRTAPRSTARNSTALHHTAQVPANAPQVSEHVHHLCRVLHHVRQGQGPARRQLLVQLPIGHVLKPKVERVCVLRECGGRACVRRVLRGVWVVRCMACVATRVKQACPQPHYTARCKPRRMCMPCACCSHLESEAQPCDARVAQPVEDGALVADVLGHLAGKREKRVSVCVCV